ncbi:adult cuticle protein 1-like [Ceratitis capitata]|uniref:adult cuticle protein 1-like n=1 Tax=Ceratitis capitata TaxID=7213 RepID=UPI0003296CF1|nr:adult cuticle protein 1-like [Ceratitis capitata]
MKFVIAVVMLALAVSVHSSILPAVSYVTSAVHPGPLLAHGGWGGHGAWAGPAAVTAWGGSGHGLWGGIPGISLSQGPHGAAIAAPLAAPLALGHGHGAGVYVAKTRGAVHTAPLAGHINSATSLNVAPAPGTW